MLFLLSVSAAAPAGAGMAPISNPDESARGSFCFRYILFFHACRLESGFQRSAF